VDHFLAPDVARAVVNTAIKRDLKVFAEHLEQPAEQLETE
jgi:hypothetical protein